MIRSNNFLKHLIVLSVIFILAINIQAGGQPSLTFDDSELRELLGDTAPGNWQKTEDAFYNHETLYDYINGGAELYLSYGFKAMLNVTFKNKGQPDIIVDLFDMGTSQNAFGVFTHSREKISQEFGQGSQYTAGLLLFWKDRYYISILASPETPESRVAVYELGNMIDSRIKKTGELPAILKHLPAEQLDEVSIRYFNHHVWQNSYYFITEENIFHMGEQTDAVLAKYSDLGILLLIEYASEVEASKALQSFYHAYLPEHPVGKITQIEDGSWTSARASDRLLKAIFNAPSENAVQALLEAVH